MILGIRERMCAGAETHHRFAGLEVILNQLHLPFRQGEKSHVEDGDIRRGQRLKPRQTLRVFLWVIIGLYHRGLEAKTPKIPGQGRHGRPRIVMGGTNDKHSMRFGCQCGETNRQDKSQDNLLHNGGEIKRD